MTAPQDHPGRILWAIDPFDTETLPDAEGLKALRTWQGERRTKVLPVYVLTLDFADRPEDRIHLSKHVAGARKAAENYLRALGADWAETPVVLIERSGSTDQAAERLSRFAEFENSPLIAVATQGHSGLPRMIFGSFAESLLRRSEVPVFFLSHREEGHSSVAGRALFATDLSEYSWVAFQEFVEHAYAATLDVTLYHRVVFPKSFESPMGTASVAFLPGGYFEEQAASAEEEGARWKRWAHERGVKVSVRVTTEYGNTSELILRAAEDVGAGLIGMASQSGPIASFLLGSVARGVFRPHGLPVWVCGPAALAKGASKSNELDRVSELQR